MAEEHIPDDVFTSDDLGVPMATEPQAEKTELAVDGAEMKGVDPVEQKGEDKPTTLEPASGTQPINTSDDAGDKKRNKGKAREEEEEEEEGEEGEEEEEEEGEVGVSSESDTEVIKSKAEKAAETKRRKCEGKGSKKDRVMKNKTDTHTKRATGADTSSDAEASTQRQARLAPEDGASSSTTTGAAPEQKANRKDSTIVSHPKPWGSGKPVDVLTFVKVNSTDGIQRTFEVGGFVTGVPNDPKSVWVIDLMVNDKGKKYKVMRLHRVFQLKDARGVPADAVVEHNGRPVLVMTNQYTKAERMALSQLRECSVCTCADEMRETDTHLLSKSEYVVAVDAESGELLDQKYVSKRLAKQKEDARGSQHTTEPPAAAATTPTKKRSKQTKYKPEIAFKFVNPSEVVAECGGDVAKYLKAHNINTPPPQVLEFFEDGYDESMLAYGKPRPKHSKQCESDDESGDDSKKKKKKEKKKRSKDDKKGKSKGKNKRHESDRDVSGDGESSDTDVKRKVDDKKGKCKQRNKKMKAESSSSDSDSDTEDRAHSRRSKLDVGDPEGEATKKKDKKKKVKDQARTDSKDRAHKPERKSGKTAEREFEIPSDLESGDDDAPVRAKHKSKHVRFDEDDIATSSSDEVEEKKEVRSKDVTSTKEHRSRSAESKTDSKRIRIAEESESSSDDRRPSAKRKCDSSRGSSDVSGTIINILRACQSSSNDAMKEAIAQISKKYFV